MSELERRGSPDQYMMRFPEGMRDMIKEMAVKNRRTMNAEIIFHLEKALLVNEARIIFGDKAASELAALAATGDSFAGTAPAAALNETALQGGPINPR